MSGPAPVAVKEDFFVKAREINHHHQNDEIILSVYPNYVLLNNWLQSLKTGIYCP